MQEKNGKLWGDRQVMGWQVIGGCTVFHYRGNIPMYVNASKGARINPRLLAFVNVCARLSISRKAGVAETLVGALGVATLGVGRAVVSSGALVNVVTIKAVSRKASVTRARVAVSQVSAGRVDVTVVRTSRALGRQCEEVGYLKPKIRKHENKKN